MATTVADVLIETLQAWGVDVVFGLPGDGINGIMEALRTRQDKIRFVQVRHEESAAFMACGYAKFTGRLGVCLATSGPGGIHLLNGLYDAKLDGQPVLAITGLPYHDLIGTHTQQDVELDRLFVDVAKYNARVMGPAHVENVTDLACRTALAYRGVAHITVPVDIQEMKAGAHALEAQRADSTPRTCSARSAGFPPRTSFVARPTCSTPGRKSPSSPAAARSTPTDELEAIAERLGAPIVKALLGQGRGAGRQPLHDGVDRPARDPAVAGGAGGVRHAADGRHVVPVHRVPAQARPGARRPDRPRSRAHRPALSGRGRPGR